LKEAQPQNLFFEQMDWKRFWTNRSNNQ